MVYNKHIPQINLSEKGRMKPMNIQWTPPAPRKGLIGKWDEFVGPGQTKAELWMIWGGGLALAAACIAYFFSQQVAIPNIWQIILLVVMAIDISGGIITNATSPAKCWYHRSGQGTKQHLGFIAIHGLYLLLVGCLFLDCNWLYFFVFFTYMLLTTIIALSMPLYLQHPMAFMLYAGAIVLNLTSFARIPGLEWFIPFLFLKLLVAYLLTEAPFRPEEQSPKK
jgi:hypothetical protein